MRRIISILFLLCTAMTGWADDSDYYVESWDYLAIVHSDNTWDVHERIDVNFVQPHHGIFLYKPCLFADFHDFEGEEHRYLYRLEYDDVSVPGYNFITDDNDDSQENLIIQIGDEDITLTGMQSYTINYKIHYPDDRVSDGDYVFHSVLGDGWPSNIRHFHYEVRFDKPLSQEATDECYIYSGSWDEQGDQLNVAENSVIDSKSLEGKVDEIGPNQAISFRLSLPEGYFVDVEKRSSTLPYILYGLALLLGAWLFYHLLQVHVDTPVTSIEFYPPKGVSGAEVGTIIDGSADPKDLVSLIPYFAQKGYIEIEEKKGEHMWNKDTIILHRKKSSSSNAPEYQRLFLNALFPSGDTSDLSQLGDRHVQIQEALRSLKGLFKGEQALDNVSGYIMLVPVISLLLWAAYSVDTQLSFSDSDQLFAGGVIFLIQMGLFFWRVSSSDVRAFSGKSHFSLYASILAAVAVCYFIYETIDPVNFCVPALFTAVCFAVSFAVICLSDRLSVDTPYRIEITGKLLGLKEFIRTAEKDRLKMLLDECPTYFYDILPYAIVFGLADQWADKFKDINLDQPSWYHGDNLASAMSGSSLAKSLSHTIDSNVASYVSSSSHDPSSSSSSGAGGGGGGGGGGAW